jgi:hypothetical protein
MMIDDANSWEIGQKYKQQKKGKELANDQSMGKWKNGRFYL